MTTTSIRDLLASQAMLRDLEPDDLDLLAGCSVNEVYEPGTVLAREGDEAPCFWLVRAGRAAIELFGPAGPLVIETLGPGELIGWSWVIPPYRWSSDVEALESLHVIRIDGACLRTKCEVDPAFGYRMMKRFAQLAAGRLHAAHVRLLDVYGKTLHG